MSVSLLSDFAAAMERIRAVTGCGTQRELGRFLGINQSAISDAKRRGTIPAEWLLTLLRGKGINPDWILTGKGARCLRPAERKATSHRDAEQGNLHEKRQTRTFQPMVY